MEARRLLRMIGDGRMILVLRLTALLVARSSNFLPNPQVTESPARHPLCPSHSESRRRPDVPVSNFLRVNLSQVDSSSRPVSLSVEDTFKESLNKAKEGSGSLEDLKSLVLQAVSDLDPSTGQPYVHDRWLTFPTAEVRVHHESRKSLFTPFEDQDFLAFDVEGARMTLIIDHGRWSNSMVFRRLAEQGDVELDKTFVGATCFCKSEMNIEDPDPLVERLWPKRQKVSRLPVSAQIWKFWSITLPTYLFAVGVRSASNPNLSRTRAGL